MPRELLKIKRSRDKLAPTGILRDSIMKDPCISLCKFTDDICIGCGRSKREIKSWKKLDKDEKRAVLAEAALRLKTLKATGRRKKK